MSAFMTINMHRDYLKLFYWDVAFKWDIAFKINMFLKKRIENQIVNQVVDLEKRMLVVLVGISETVEDSDIHKLNMELYRDFHGRVLRILNRLRTINDIRIDRVDLIEAYSERIAKELEYLDEKINNDNLRNHLISLITPENIHSEIDFGVPVGNEAWR